MTENENKTIKYCNIPIVLAVKNPVDKAAGSRTENERANRKFRMANKVVVLVLPLNFASDFDLVRTLTVDESR